MIDDLDVARAAARAASEAALRLRGGVLSPERKGSATDLVTDADRAAEAAAVALLQVERPRDGIIGEEGTMISGARQWLVDGIDGTLACSVHQSHAYTTGACCYFTFGGQPPPNERERYYNAVYDAGMGAAIARGAALSHHHGVGLNRARFVPDALGPAFDVLVALKAALDPHGILNPGKLIP